MSNDTKRSLPFMVCGTSESDKPRFINALAQHAIMQADTATRCPVHLKVFPVSRAEEVSCTISWRNREERVSPDRLPERLSAIMDTIRAENNDYSEDVLEVVLQLLNVRQISMIDLPNLVSPAEPVRNAKVAAMWQKYSSKSSIVPIVLLSMKSSTLAVALQSISDAISPTDEGGDGSALVPTGDLLRRALVVVTHLEAAIQSPFVPRECQLQLDNVVGHIKGRNYGFSEERLSFITLKPADALQIHYPRGLQQAAAAAAPNNNGAPNFFTLGDDEETLLKHLGVRALRPNVNMGLSTVVHNIHQATVNHQFEQLESMLKMSTSEFASIKKEIRTFDTSFNLNAVRTEAQEFVRIYCAFLHALSTMDHSKFADVLTSIDVDADTWINVSDVAAEESKTLQEEIYSFGMCNSELVIELNKLDCMNPKTKLQAKEGTARHAFLGIFEDKLIGNSSLVRLLRVWKYVVLVRTSEDFTVDEMHRLGCMTDMNGTRSWSLEWSLKKMVERRGAFLRCSIKDLTTWARRLFGQFVVIANKVVPQATSKLRNFPILRDALCQALSRQYEALVLREATNTGRIMNQDIAAYFSSLSLDAPFVQLRLWCSTEMEGNLLTSQRAEASLPEALAARVGVFLSPKRVSEMSKMGYTKGGNSTILDVFAMCTTFCGYITTADFSLGQGPKFERVLDSELEAEADRLNKIVNSMAYLHNGSVLSTADHTFTVKLEQPLKKLYEVLSSTFISAMGVLDDKQLAAIALSNVAQRTEHLAALERQLRQNKTVQENLFREITLLSKHHVLQRTPADEYDDAELQLVSVADEIAGLSTQHGVNNLPNHDDPQSALTTILQEAELSTMRNTELETNSTSLRALEQVAEQAEENVEQLKLLIVKARQTLANRRAVLDNMRAR